MPEYHDGLGGLADMARALNDDELEDRMEAARVALRRDTDALIDHAEKLRESVAQLQGGAVHRIHQEPTAEVALTEDELRGVIEGIERYVAQVDFLTSEQTSARDKLSQALAIESGPGGRFHGDTAA